MLLPGIASAASRRRCACGAPRTAAGFAGSVGLVMLVFFAFSKQAFANYYFFVIGALCCAAAVSVGPRPRRDAAATAAQIA